MRGLALLLLALSPVVAEPDDVQRAITAWKGTNEKYGLWLNREEVVRPLEALLHPGMATSEVQNVLGAPQSEWRHPYGSVWTYCLYRRKFLQVVFDSEAKVRSAPKTTYLSARDLSERHGLNGVGTNDAQTSTEAGLALAVGAWRATIGRDRADADRLDLGRRVIRCVRADTASTTVEAALGSPVSTTTQGGNSVWTYRIGPSQFIQVLLSGGGQVLCAWERDYDSGTGQPQTLPLVEQRSLQKIDERLLDIVAWQGTLPGADTRTDDRRGIGKRMEMCLKVGMTMAEVEQMMGTPDDVSSNTITPLIWGYNLHTDSAISIDFDRQGRVTKVSHIGT